MPEKSYEIDEVDRRLLRSLQNDSTVSLEALGERLSLSANACWRRIKRLERDGVILRRIALVDPEKVGLGLTVFVWIRTSQHTEDWSRTFAAAAAAIPEVLEFYRLAGEIDYMLKLQVRDIADYDRVYRKLIAAVPIADVSASIAMEAIKNQTAIPV